MRNRILLAAILMLSGCGSFEGHYAPSCIAFSGSEIRFEGGRFTWWKFTDQVRVDEQGNEIDPFPGYPLEGTYSANGRRITLQGGDGRSPVEMMLFRADGAVFLYTAEEAAAFESTGVRPVCPLQLQSKSTKS